VSDTTEVRIRPARLEDAVAVAELSGELGYPTPPEQGKRRLSSILESVDHEAFVATDQDGSVVGWIHVFATLRLEADAFAELGGLVIAASHRGHGIGKRLVAAAESWARQRGLDRVRVRSKASRGDARRFYQHDGYSRVKTQEILDKALSDDA
jgi:GNAT superfamily N-acetyltransferase